MGEVAEKQGDVIEAKTLFSRALEMHIAHGWLTPVEFVEAWLKEQQLQLASRVAHN